MCFAVQEILSKEYSFGDIEEVDLMVESNIFLPESERNAFVKVSSDPRVVECLVS